MSAAETVMLDERTSCHVEQSDFTSRLKGGRMVATFAPQWFLMAPLLDDIDLKISSEETASSVAKSAFEHFIQAPADQDTNSLAPNDQARPNQAPASDLLTLSQEVLENVIEDEFVERIEAAFGLEANVQINRKSKFRFMCLLKSKVTGQTAHHVLIEFKRPNRDFSLTDNTDRIASYGTDFMAENPSLGRLVLILTDGWSFYGGIICRADLSYLEIRFNSKKYELYNWYAFFILMIIY